VSDLISDQIVDMLYGKIDAAEAESKRLREIFIALELELAISIHRLPKMTALVNKALERK
jgi:hypothetical protein